MLDSEVLDAAALALSDAEALLVAAGAGMGVDSGLPDFRGPEGFWNAYPAYRHLGLDFMDLADPRWFDRDPRLAWGFYGHRLALYRSTVPHAGFEVLEAWATRLDTFVFTSNVDGQFQAAGFESKAIEECHGSIHHLQCTRPCQDGIWSAEAVEPDVDPESFRARGELPTCPWCGQIARPNILMFGDGRWLGNREAEQRARMRRWRDRTDPKRTVIVECGAGTAVPTVRFASERLQAQGATLIRINPREAFGPLGTLGIAAGAAEALLALQSL